MLGKQLFLSLNFFVIFVAIRTEPCIEAPPMKDVNPRALTADWFVYRKTDENGDVAKATCMKVGLYPQSEENTVHAVLLWSDTSAHDAHKVDENVAQLYENGHGVTSDGFPTIIIGSDYTNWAIVVACDVRNKKRIIWGLTMQAEPDDSTVSAFFGSLSQYNITESELSTPDQSFCPKTWKKAHQEEHI